MEIKIDYYLKDEKNATRFMHITITEEDILKLLKEQFRNGELPCPIGFDRETCNIEFVIDKVIC